MRVACPVCGKPREVDEFCEHPERASKETRSYDRYAWQKKRAAFLRRHTQCVECGAKAEVADHEPIPRDELVRMGVADPDAEKYLQPKCYKHHNAKGNSHRAKMSNDPA